MFKLVAVGGKIRGKEIILNEGENILGRSPEADHMITVDGVSKKHLSITVNGENCFVEDLGSSNGTFVNGKLVTKSTVVDGDKVALPNIIFQLVYVKEKKVVIKKQVVKNNEEEADLDFAETKPNDLPGKLKYFFKHNLMKVIYSFNEQYEWNFLLAILLLLLTCGNIYLTIGPILSQTKSLINGEVIERGKQIADEIVRANSIYLSRGDLQRIDTNFLERLVNSGDIEGYELTDMEGRIVRPRIKIDTLDTDVFTAKSLNAFKRTGKYEESYVDNSITGKVGIAKVLQVNDITTGRNKPVGVIAIRFQPDSLRKYETMNNSAYLRALVYTTIYGAFFFGFIYYLTIRPIQDMRKQSEEVMRGKKKEINLKYLFEELNPLKNTLNTVLQKNRELLNEDVDTFGEVEEDGPYVSILQEILQGCPGPAIVLNSEKNVEFVNEKAGDLTGMRENLVQGSNILDAASNEGFAGTLIKLADDAANNSGLNQTDYYELEGDSYIINVMALMGKDNFAKAFLITFMKE